MSFSLSLFSSFSLDSLFHHFLQWFFALFLLFLSLLFLWFVVWKLILSQIPFFQEIFGLVKKKKKTNATLWRIKPIQNNGGNSRRSSLAVTNGINNEMKSQAESFISSHHVPSSNLLPAVSSLASSPSTSSISSSTSRGSIFSSSSVGPRIPPSTRVSIGHKQ
jgi:hypothetical protein